MILEFACGGELFTHMRNAGHLSDSDTQFYIAELALLLQYLHDLKIAYRDLKPGAYRSASVDSEQSD